MSIHIIANFTFLRQVKNFIKVRWYTEINTNRNYKLRTEINHSTYTRKHATVADLNQRTLLTCLSTDFQKPEISLVQFR